MSALLIIDLQQDFLSPTQIHPKPFIDSLPRLLRQFTTRRRPIIWIDSKYETNNESALDMETPQGSTETHPPANPKWELYLSGTHQSGRFCVPNTPGIQIHCVILPLIHDHDTRITKTYYSAFTDTPLHTTLQQTRTTHLFLAGVTTNTCISATALSALNLRYKVTLITDTISAFQPHLHSRALHTLTQAPYNVPTCTSHTITSHLTSTNIPVLYYVNGSIPSWRVMLTLAWLQIPYIAKRLRVMSTPKETRSADFAAINPRCKTPTFIDSDGTVVTESMAISQYLERFYGGRKEGGNCCGDDRKGVVVVGEEPTEAEWTRSMIRFHETEIPHGLYEPIELLFTPPSEWQTHRDRIVEGYHAIYEELQHWEGYLRDSGGSFLSADQKAFGIVDCALYPILAYMMHRGLVLTETKFPCLIGYSGRCGEMRAAREARPEGWERVGKSLFAKAEKLVREGAGAEGGGGDGGNGVA